MILEKIERRVLGAVRCLDGTTAQPIARRISITGERMTFVRNLGGLYVVMQASELEKYTESFQAQPTDVTVESVTRRVTVHDPLGLYLPRQMMLSLPRDSSAENATNETSLFRSVDIHLFASPAAVPFPGWALIRLTIVRKASRHRLPWCLIRVIRTGGTEPRLLAVGLADQRGEALVPVVGIPVTTFAETSDTVVATDMEVALEVVIDPAVHPLQNLEEMEQGQDPNGGYLPNPEIMADAPASASFPGIRIASGRTRIETLEI